MLLEPLVDRFVTIDLGIYPLDLGLLASRAPLIFQKLGLVSTELLDLLAEDCEELVEVLLTVEDACFENASHSIRLISSHTGSLPLPVAALAGGDGEAVAVRLVHSAVEPAAENRGHDHHDCRGDPPDRAAVGEHEVGITHQYDRGDDDGRHDERELEHAHKEPIDIPVIQEVQESHISSLIRGNLLP